MVAALGYVEPFAPGFGPFAPRMPFGFPQIFGAPMGRPPMAGGGDSVYGRAVDQLRTS